MTDTPAEQLADKISDVTCTVGDPTVVFEALLMNIVAQMAACCPSCRQQMARELERNIPAMLDKAAEAQRIALQFGTIKALVRRSNMLSHQEEQIERRRVLENDKRIREQGSTFLAHTHNDLAGGRFAAVGAATVIGSTAVPQYPQASTPFQRDPVPDEPPIGFENPVLDNSACLGEAPPSALLDGVERCTEPRPFRKFR